MLITAKAFVDHQIEGWPIGGRGLETALHGLKPAKRILVKCIDAMGTQTASSTEYVSKYVATREIHSCAFSPSN